MSAIPFPLNIFMPYLLRRQTLLRLKLLGMTERNVEQRVRHAYEILSDLLEENYANGGEVFFFGSRPTTVDALVFGHLTAAFTEPIVNILFQMCKERNSKHMNLIRYWRQINDFYFGNAPAVNYGLGPVSVQVACNFPNVFPDTSSKH